MLPALLFPLSAAIDLHASIEWQIEAYSAAAPSFLSSKATILDSTQKVLRNGTNGWTCMPANPSGPASEDGVWASAREAAPVCFDAAGLDWMKGWMARKKPLMKRDAFVWMLQGDVGFDNTDPFVTSKEEADPDQWIESGPHLMMFPKDPASTDAFTSDFSLGEPYTMFPGTDFAHLMIPFPGYYDNVPGVTVEPNVEPANESHVSAAWQVWAYTSAAPDFLGNKATVLDPDSKVLREGTNGWTCMSANPQGKKAWADPKAGWASAREAAPVCFDAAGLDWMKGWMARKKPLMKRDAFVWMLQGDLGFDNTDPFVTSKEEADPDQWIESGPHLMMFPKDPAALSDAFTSDFSLGEPYTMFPGTDFAHLMIPASGYYGEETTLSPEELLDLLMSPPYIYILAALVLLLASGALAGGRGGSKAGTQLA